MSHSHVDPRVTCYRDHRTRKISQSQFNELPSGQNTTPTEHLLSEKIYIGIIFLFACESNDLLNYTLVMLGHLFFEKVVFSDFIANL